LGDARSLLVAQLRRAKLGDYLAAVLEGCFAVCWIESLPVMIVPLLNGGLAFAGKSGRNNASACDTNAIQTIVIAAAHFMSRGLIKLRKRDKTIFAWR
jgi:hypothetical protein